MKNLMEDRAGLADALVRSGMEPGDSPISDLVAVTATLEALVILAVDRGFRLGVKRGDEAASDDVIDGAIELSTHVREHYDAAIRLMKA